MKLLSFVSIVLLSLLFWACPTASTCSASTCATGCCDVSGRCQASTNPACGVQGASCQACPLSTACLSGVCVATGSSGGGSGAQGGGSAGGTSTAGGSAGGGQAGGRADAGNPTAYEAFLERAAATYCAELARCGRADPSAQGCREAFFASAVPVQFALPRSVRTGAASFDPALGARCLETIDGGCGRLSCFDVNAPEASLGGRCFSEADCTDPTLGCNGVVCGRQCSRGGALGDSCNDSRPCDPSLACIDRLCQPVPAFNMPCTFRGCGTLSACLTTDGGLFGPDARCVRLPSTGPCLAFAQCAPDAFCDSTNQCRALLAPGAVCQGDRQCRAGDFCNGVCTARRMAGAACVSGNFGRECADGLVCLAGRCAAPTEVRGAPCLGAEQRLNGGCATSLLCDAVTLRCERRTGALPGQPCSNTRLCAEDVCRGFSYVQDGGPSPAGRCGPSQPGDECQTNSNCSGSTYCEAGRCALARAATACTSDANCLPGSFCNGSTCAPRAGNGQSCPSLGTCADPRHECLPSPTGSRCQPVPTLGQPCTTRCQLPFGCVGGTCVAGGRPGTPCLSVDTSETCLEGECEQTDGGSRCTSRQPLGARCSHDDGCGSSFCDFASQFDGVCAPGVCR